MKEEADSTDLHQKLHSLGALAVNDYLLAEGVVVNNVAKPGSRASWLMRLSGGLIVSQAAIKTGFGPWVNTKGQPRAPEDLCSLRHRFANVIRDSVSWHKHACKSSTGKCTRGPWLAVAHLSSCPCPVCLVWSGAPLVTELRTRLPSG